MDGSGIKHLLYKHEFMRFPEHTESQTRGCTSVATSATSALLRRDGRRRSLVGETVSGYQTLPQTRWEGHTNTWGSPLTTTVACNAPHCSPAVGEREGERFFWRRKIMCKWKKKKLSNLKISPTTNDFFSEHRFSPLSSFPPLSIAICRWASYPEPATASTGFSGFRYFCLHQII